MLDIKDAAVEASKVTAVGAVAWWSKVDWAMVWVALPALISGGYTLHKWAIMILDRQAERRAKARADLEERLSGSHLGGNDNG